MTVTVGAPTQVQPDHAHAVLHCNLNTVDIARAEVFYVSVLDLQVRMRQASPDTDGTAMGLGPHTDTDVTFLYDWRGPRSAPALELVRWNDPATRLRAEQGQAPGYASIGFRTTELAAIEGLLAIADATVSEVAGGVIVRGRRRPALRTTDPDGTVLEVVEVPDSTAPSTGGALSHQRVWCTDLERSIQWWGAIGWSLHTRAAEGEPGWASMVLPTDPTFSVELMQFVDPAYDGPHTRANDQGLFRMALAVEDVVEAHEAVRAKSVDPVPDPVFYPMPDTPTGGFTVLFMTDPDGAVAEFVDRPRSAVRRPNGPL